MLVLKKQSKLTPWITNTVAILNLAKIYIKSKKKKNPQATGFHYDQFHPLSSFNEGNMEDLWYYMYIILSDNGIT